MIGRRCGAFLLLATVMVGCGRAPSEPTAAPTTLPAETVTITETATMTVTETATVEVTVTPTAAPTSPEPGLDDAPSDEPAPRSATPDFDSSYAKTVAEYIIEDITTVDERLQDGIEVSSALDSLASSYERMVDAGVPPGAEPSAYLARLDTLQSFAQMSADEYDADPVEASARYEVVRQETEPLFEALNSAMGTEFEVP